VCALRVCAARCEVQSSGLRVTADGCSEVWVCKWVRVLEVRGAISAATWCVMVVVWQRARRAGDEDDARCGYWLRTRPRRGTAAAQARPQQSVRAEHAASAVARNPRPLLRCLVRMAPQPACDAGQARSHHAGGVQRSAAHTAATPSSASSALNPECFRTLLARRDEASGHGRPTVPARTRAARHARAGQQCRDEDWTLHPEDHAGGRPSILVFAEYNAALGCAGAVAEMTQRPQHRAARTPRRFRALG
jgi:hypothetical protein